MKHRLVLSPDIDISQKNDLFLELLRSILILKIIKYQFLGLCVRQKCIHVNEHPPKLDDCASFEVLYISLRPTVLDKMHFLEILRQIHRVRTKNAQGKKILVKITKF